MKVSSGPGSNFMSTRRPRTNLKDSKNYDKGVGAAKVGKDEFMGNVSGGEGKIDDLFGEARPGEGVGEAEEAPEQGPGQPQVQIR